MVNIKKLLNTCLLYIFTAGIFSCHNSQNSNDSSSHIMEVDKLKNEIFDDLKGRTQSMERSTISMENHEELGLILIGADQIELDLLDDEKFTTKEKPFIFFSHTGKEALNFIEVLDNGSNFYLRTESGKEIPFSGGILNEHLMSLMYSLTDGRKLDNFNLTIIRNSSADLTRYENIDFHIQPKFVNTTGIGWRLLTDNCRDGGPGDRHEPPCKCHRVPSCRKDRGDGQGCNVLAAKCHNPLCS